MTKDTYAYYCLAIFFGVIGFFSPAVWLIAGFFLIVAITGSREGHNKAVEKTWKNATVDDANWRDLFHTACESPAETAFLDILIKEYNLKPDRGLLKSETLVCELQFVDGRYRYDFLLNGRQIVEVDGHEYHSSQDAKERDRIRDEFSVSRKYHVLRIPAYIVFKYPQRAILSVRDALVKSELPIAPNRPQIEPETKKSFFAHTSEAMAGFDRFMDDVDFRVQVSKHLDEFEKTVKAESEQIDFVVDYAENMIKHPDIYTLDHLSKLVWTKILLPKDSANDKVRQQVNERVEELVGERNARFKGIKERCVANEVFGRNMKNILIEMKCPVETGKKLSFSVYPFFYLMRHATTDDLN
ncbi:endonuclease domain-containing protein (plasmid) [Brucella pituitosa]|uniref:endonuclease domain-containing protein n=1 Tax=Brucella pituitosa TaxID=571256 RepID=UPI003C76E8DE